MLLRTLRLAVLLGCASGLLSLQDAEELVLEVLPDGTRVEMTVRAGADRVLEFHGDYRRVHRNGQVLVRGVFRSGLRGGRWIFKDAQGEKRATGAYRDGKRSGSWAFYYPGGEDLAEGKYKGGRRTGDWETWDEEGLRVRQQSGAYSDGREFHANGALAAEGSLLDGSRHGWWSTYWKNGSRQIEAEYIRGRIVGTPRFFHMEGTEDPGILEKHSESGWDHWDLETEPLFAQPWSLRSISEPGTPESSDLSDLPTLSVARSGSDATAWEAAMETVLRGAPAQWPAAIGVLRSGGPAALPIVLNGLRSVDLAKLDGASRATAIQRDLLRTAFNGQGFGWQASIEPDAVEANTLSILRWFSLHERHRSSPIYWEVDARWGVLRHENAERLFASMRDTSAWLAAPTEPLRRDAPEASARRWRVRRGMDVMGPLDAGLAWLARHQSEDGSWSCEEFRERCAAPDQERCGDPGNPAMDVGVTSLALLALLQNGSSMRAGPYALEVEGAVKWLLGKQDQKTGRIGDCRSYACTMQHAIATEALCRAYAGLRSTGIADAFQHAVDCIVEARTPYQAWRYQMPSVGENDIVVTGWMIQALAAATDVGLHVDPDSVSHAMSWINSVTDSYSGRVGYHERGTTSSRYAANSAGYPQDRGEATTAVGLLCELLVGRGGPAAQLAAKQLKLLVTTPPSWRRGGCDMYYWYHGPGPWPCPTRGSGNIGSWPS